MNSFFEWKVSAGSQERWETGTHNKVWYDENERKADPAGVAVNAVERTWEVSIWLEGIGRDCVHTPEVNYQPHYFDRRCEGE
jgi:predicted lipoprotein